MRGPRHNYALLPRKCVGFWTDQGKPMSKAETVAGNQSHTIGRVDSLSPIPEIIDRVKQGFSCDWQVAARAPLMRSHAQAGNTERAEEYAREITEIQRAHGVDVYDESRFVMGLECWADIVTHGTRVPRAIPNAETETEALDATRRYRTRRLAQVIDTLPQNYRVAAE